MSSPEATDLAEEMAYVPHGREWKLLTGHTFVERIIRSLRGTANTAAAIEDQLNSLFAQLQAGHEFAHTELVMALLFAAKRADVSSLGETLDVLDKSRAPEVAKLRRFALTLR
jgi:hypothetical protein